MATKRGVAKAQVANGMTEEEACQILQVVPTADRELITQAYGLLVRKYQPDAASDRKARQRLDELNQAYLVLYPAANVETTPPAPIQPSPEYEPISMGEFFAEVSRLIARISSRWRGRVLEVGILLVTTAWLGLLALSAGASPLWTVLALAIAGAAIAAPWRRA